MLPWRSSSGELIAKRHCCCITLPGHLCRAGHGLTSTTSPTQCVPPLAVGGWEQDRILYTSWLCVPHVKLQLLQALQSSQTSSKKQIALIYLPNSHYICSNPFDFDFQTVMWSIWTLPWRVYPLTYMVNLPLDRLHILPLITLRTAVNCFTVNSARNNAVARIIAVARKTSRQPLRAWSRSLLISRD